MSTSPAFRTACLLVGVPLLWLASIPAHAEDRAEAVGQPLGLYVQFVGARSARVRWETAEPTPSVVEWGVTEQLGQRAQDPTLRREHSVSIDGLKCSARHYYRIGSGDDARAPAGDVFWFDNAINFSVPDVSAAIWPGDVEAPRAEPTHADETDAAASQQVAQHIVDTTSATKGYALVYGLHDGRLAFELARRTELTILCADDDADRLDEIGQRLLDADVYGLRIKLHHVDDLGDSRFPSRFFNLITSERTVAGGPLPGKLAEVKRLLRPQGGVFMAPRPKNDAARKQQLFDWSASDPELQVVEADAGSWLHLTRGPDPGTTWWTHQYGGPHNAGNNFDSLGDLQTTDDLQLQWIGRPGLDAGLDRQVRMPAPLSCNGRIYHQGWNRIMAADSYNGSILWSLEIPQLRRVNMPRDASNMCADQQAVYLAVRDACWQIDGATGKRSAMVRVDRPERDWGVVFRTGDLLIGSAVQRGSIYTRFWGPDHWYEGHPGLVWGGTHEAAANQVLSDELFAIDLQTGERQWTYTGGMVLNTTVAVNQGMLLFVESRTPQVQGQLSGEAGTIENALRVWDDIHLVALDVTSGKQLWQRPLSKSPSLSDQEGDRGGEHEDWPTVRGGVAAFYLLTANVAGDVVAVIQSSYPLTEADSEFKEGAENNGFFSLDGFRATRDHVDHLWSQQQRWNFVVKKKLRRAVVVGDRVVLGAAAYGLADGSVENTSMPEFGCGTLTAIGDVLIGRFDDTGKQDTYYDVTLWDMSSGKTSSWTPLRPSCWLSTISGGGMLLVPEAGGGCSCQVYFGASVGFAPIEPGQPK